MQNPEKIAILRGYWMQLKPDRQPELSMRAAFSCYAGKFLGQGGKTQLLCVSGKIFGPNYPAVSELQQQELESMRVKPERITVLTTPIDSYTETIEAMHLIRQNWPEFSGEILDVGFKEHLRTIKDFVYPALGLPVPKLVSFEEIFDKNQNIPPAIKELFHKFKRSQFERNFWIWENLFKRLVYITIGAKRASERNAQTRQIPKPNVTFLPIDTYRF